MSHLLDNFLGDNHRFIDMNIYFSDDELRKQAESMVSKMVVTGQEAVEGNTQGMRQDLYKKAS